MYGNQIINFTQKYNNVFILFKFYNTKITYIKISNLPIYEIFFCNKYYF